MVSLVNSRGTWVLAQSRHKDKIENPGLVQQRQSENRKHADFYAPVGFAFFAFAVFGSVGPTDSYGGPLPFLADHEHHRQRDSILARQGLLPLLLPGKPSNSPRWRGGRHDGAEGAISTKQFTCLH